MNAKRGTSPLVNRRFIGKLFVASIAVFSLLGAQATSSIAAKVNPSLAAAPGSPTAVSASSGNQSIIVSWSAPASNGGASITRYTATASPGGATCTTPAALSCTISGLVNGTSYSVVVTAANSAGTSRASTASNAVIPQPTAPSAPTGITGVSGDRQASISWATPSTNGGSPITSYVVTATPGGFSCTSLAPTACTVTGLANGSDYTFTVVAVNAIGTSKPSSVTSTITPRSVPGAPTNVVARSASSSLVVTWVPPVDDGGADITSFTATVDPGGRTCIYAVALPEADQCTISGLTNGTAYLVSVTAANEAGVGPASSQSTNAIPVGPPSSPRSLSARTGSGQIAMSWSAPTDNGGSSITGYTATAKPGRLSCTAVSTSCTITGLTNGTAYSVTVVATNIAGPGTSAGISSIVPSTVPGAPTSVVAKALNRKAEVTWNPPSSTGGLPITSYTITASPGGATCIYYLSVPETDSCIVSGLVNGISYTFSVTATNGAGTGAASTPSSAVIPKTTPGTPMDVTAAVGNHQATVSWSAPSNDGGSAISRYSVVAKPGGASCSTSGATTCVVSGLTNGTSYTFKVTAANAAGSGPQSAPSPVAIPAAVPGAPTSVQAARGNAKATVSWTPPAQTGGSDIESYTVTASPGGLSCSYLVATPEIDSCKVLGLTNGTSYTFSVVALNDIGTSPSSTSSSAVTPLTTPSAPIGIDAVPGASSADVSWETPSSNGGSSITSYQVTALPGGQTCSTAGATSCSVNGLSNGVSYRFVVAATNAAGRGPSSLPSAAVVPVTMPGVPTSVTATPGGGQAIVSWVPPASDGGSPVLDYVVTASPGGATCVYYVSAPESDLCTVSGLSDGTAYSFTVVAASVIGAGASSNASSSVTPIDPPGIPLGVQATSSSTSAAVSWSAPASNGGSAVTGYSVVAVEDQSKSCTTTGALACTVTNLVNGSSYTFVVQASNAAGRGYASVPSDAVIPSTLASAPNTVMASPGNQRLVVSWLPPLNIGGSAITSYLVTSSPGSSTCSYAVAVPEVDSCTLTGLTNGTAYSVNVYAINGNGTSSAGVLPGTATPISVPGVPTGVSTTIGNQVVTVLWRPPATNGGGAITSYQVTASPGGQTCTQPVASPEVDSCTVVGLTNGTGYTFAVAAVNAVGSSASSSSSSRVTPATTPGPPSAVSASAASTQATVSWTTPSSTGGASISSYTVTAQPGGQNCSSSQTSCTVVGLTNGTEYSFTVAATNAIGTGSASAPSNQVTPGTFPGAPTGVSATYGNTQARISWTPPVSDGGFRITQYVATATPGGQSCTYVIAAPETDTCTVTSLTNGTSYNFKVVATNTQGSSVSSSPSASIVPATFPTAPTNVQASPGHLQAMVTWSQPLSSGGRPITSYVVTADPGGSTCTSTSLLSCTVAGLTDGTAYTFTAIASNLVGPSSNSVRSSSMVPGMVINGITVYPGGSFVGADLSGANLSNYALTNADLTNANLSNANLAVGTFAGTILTGAKFSNTNVTGANFSGSTLGMNTWQGVIGVPAALPANWMTVGGFLVGPKAILRDSNLSGLNLRGARLMGADLASANLSGANLSGADFTGSKLIGAYFASANLTNSVMTEEDLTGANLSGAIFGGANFTGANLTGANLSNAVTGPCIVGGNYGFGCATVEFAGANLTNANLTGAALYAMQFQNANLTNANLTNVLTVGCSPSGVIFYYSTYFCNSTLFQGATLTNANLTGANLAGAVFGGSLLSGGITGTPANLQSGWSLLNGYLVGSGVNLQQTDFSGLSLQGANFAGADLTGANFNGSNLAGASFRGANLSTATFNGANATNVVFSGANLSGTSFSQAVLAGVSSVGTTGVPINLPAGWSFVAGYLVGAGAKLNGATLNGANLSGQAMSGADLTNAVLTAADLTGANLSGAIFGGANFTGANLTGANLSNAVTGPCIVGGNYGFGCATVEFAGANLTNANLTGAALYAMQFQNANLTNANLTNVLTVGCSPSGVIFYYSTYFCNSTLFQGATLTNANLTGANLAGAVFGGSLLSGGITGTPANLQSGWSLLNGYLFGP